MRTGLSSMKNVLASIAKNVQLSLGKTAAASAKDVAIQKQIYRSGITALIISNKEMKYITKIVKSLEESGLLIKDISETI